MNSINHNRYVAHFDMLGFKNAILRNVDEAWGALSDLRDCMDRILNIDIQDLSSGQIISDRIRAYIFSDSILVFSLGNSPADLKSILMLITQLFASCLASSGPLRGGISYGEFFFNPDLHLFCGEPFVKAYQIAERAQWSGIVVDDIVAEHFYRKNINLSSHGTPALTQWDVPVKPCGNQRHWVVNWPKLFKNNFRKNIPICVAQYYLAFERLFGAYKDLPENVRIKYENTVGFINTVGAASVTTEGTASTGTPPDLGG
jgi:hypothetical protein